MPPQQVKAICFDVGNVLLEVDIAYAIARLGPQVDDRLRQKIQVIGQWEMYDAFERGHLLEAQFLLALRAHLAVDLEHAELVAWWNSSLRNTVDGVESVVSELVGRLPVYALSNTNPTHFAYFIQQMPLLQRFDEVITSFHIGYRKPEAELFAAVAQRIGQAPEDILLIDDLMANVHGARAAGFQAEICERSSARLRDILIQYGVL